MWQFATPALGVRALMCAAVLLAWRAIDARSHAGRFGAIFAHYAANLAFWGVLGWCWDEHWRAVGVLALFALAAVSIYAALRAKAEAFAVYGVGYTALGLCLVILQSIRAEVRGAAIVLGIVLAAAALLHYLHHLLKNERS